MKFGAFICGIALCASVASADSVEIAASPAGSSDNLGRFVGEIELVGDELIITLANTSPADNGGFITGLVFNILGDGAATFIDEDADTTDGVDESLFDAGFPAVEPFDAFEFGVTLAGDVSNGIGVGESGVFRFNVTPGLALNDFLTEEAGGSAGLASTFFATRFEGFNNGRADKVPASGENPDPDPTPIPLPAAAFAGLSLLGMMGAGNTLRRRRDNARA